MTRKKLLLSGNLYKLLILILVLSFTNFSCKTINPNRIIVFAAASLADPLTKISKDYTDSEIIFDFAGSYTLSNKIRFGSKADLVIFAGMDPLENLIENKYIDEGSVNVILTNGLAMVCSIKIECPIGYQAFDSPYKIAIADPQLAPLGKYSKAFIEEIGLWPKIKNKLIYNFDARSTIVSVETGNVPLGIVYFSDAITSDRVDIILSLENTPNVAKYPVALIEKSLKKQKALKFIEFLKSEKSSKIFSDYGFKSVN